MGKNDMEWVSVLALWIVLIGGLNWGLVGVFNFNLVEMFASTWSWVVYVIVGISALIVGYHQLTDK